VRPTTPEEALDLLLEGNARFVEGKSTGHDFAARREEVADEQQPYAVVLSCSDSRVPSELVFDATLGDLFVCRVAGNVLDPFVVGSIEYAVAHLSPVLVVVMGHERCGAVTAAVELVNGGGSPGGSIHAVVDALGAVLEPGMSVGDAVRANALAGARALPERSAIVREAMESDALRVVPSVYSLDSGRVELLD
jgi:carbonic anhydrase